MNIQKAIQEKIAAQQAIIDAHGISQAEAFLIYASAPPLPDTLDRESALKWSEYLDDNRNAIIAHNAYEMIEGLELTAAANVFYAEKRYIIGQEGDKLLSPCGFSPEDRVFVSTGSFVLQVDDTADAPKSSNKTLVVWDMEKEAAQ